MAEVLKGVFEIKGVLRYADQTLRFAYHTKGVKGQASEEEVVALPLEEMQEVQWKGWLQGSKILLRPRQLSTLGRLPWASHDLIAFNVKRPHHAQAASLVAQLQQDLSGLEGDAVNSIPFQLPDANWGMTEIKGLLYLDEEFLVFDVRTGVSGGAKKKRHVIKIEPRALKAIRLDQGVMRDHLAVKPKERDLFRAMPGMYKGKDELTMKIHPRYRADAEHLVDEVRALMR